MAEKNIDPLNDYMQTAPVQYINRKGSLKESGKFVKSWGSRCFISSGKKAWGAAGDQLTNSLEDHGLNWELNRFEGECCRENIEEISSKAEKMGADLIIGVGGGKSLDTAKAAAEKNEVPIVCVPTVAATCAAVTALSVLYTSSGEFLKNLYFRRSPNLVIVPPQIIAEAPVKYIQAGILDSLAKWYEGRAVFSGLEEPTVFASSALNLSRLINQKMEEKAEKAVSSVEKDKLDETVTYVLDLNIYLTGVVQSLGQIACRGAGAHAVHDGLTALDESHDILHGIKVGYGIIVQLLLEGRDREEVKQTASFFRNLNTTPSLEGLGLPRTQSNLQKIAEKSVEDPLMDNMPFEVTPDMVIDAMKKAEEII